jgi:hypothetical protein
VTDGKAPAPDAAESADEAIPLPEAPDRLPRGKPGSRHGPSALGFVGFGVGLVAFVLATPQKLLSLQWAFGAAALCGALGAGLGFLLERRRRRSHAAARAAHPDEPWLWDHPWDPTGASVTSAQRWGRASSRWSATRARRTAWLVAIVVVAGWLGPLYGTSIVWIAVLALLWAWDAWHAHGAGTTRVSYAKFPFHPGERVTLRFAVSEGGASFRRARFHLRHVREHVAHGWIRAALTQSTIVIDRPPGMLPGPEEEIELTFDVPEGAPGTRLSDPDSEPSYWVLDVVADTSAGPFTESFLVPIYERPGRPST